MFLDLSMYHVNDCSHHQLFVTDAFLFLVKKFWIKLFCFLVIRCQKYIIT